MPPYTYQNSYLCDQYLKNAVDGGGPKKPTPQVGCVGRNRSSSPRVNTQNTTKPTHITISNAHFVHFY